MSTLINDEAQAIELLMRGERISIPVRNIHVGVPLNINHIRAVLNQRGYDLFKMGRSGVDHFEYRAELNAGAPANQMTKAPAFHINQLDRLSMIKLPTYSAIRLSFGERHHEVMIEPPCGVVEVARALETLALNIIRDPILNPNRQTP